MTRSASAQALLLCALAVPALSASFDPAQTTQAAPTTQAPATPAKFYRPVKGLATIEVIQGISKKVGDNMVTIVKVKNMSSGRINLLQYDEYWYDLKRKQVSGSTEKYRKPFNPGDIIELAVTSPIKPGMQVSQIMFSHAGGKIEVKPVKQFK
jgi:hypothetical protein